MCGGVGWGFDFGSRKSEEVEGEGLMLGRNLLIRFSVIWFFWVVCECGI